MEKKIASGIMLTLILTSMLTLAFKIQMVRAEPTTWTVDDDGPADFQTIQEAIDAANPGDAIFVRVGTYFENIRVSKAVSLIGEDKDTTVIDGSGTGIVVNVNADNVSISGFTIENSGFGSGWGSGIYLGNSHWNTISSCIVVDNFYGIQLRFSNWNTIANNLVTSNDWWGVGAFYSERNVVTHNNILNNAFDAIRVENCNNSIFSGNTMLDNGAGIILGPDCINNIIEDNSIGENGPGCVGVGVNYSNHTIIRNNTIFSNRDIGIWVIDSDVNITSNVISDNAWIGIHLTCSFSFIEGNKITDNDWGLWLWEASNNTISRNNIMENNVYGTVLSYSQNNTFHSNNFVDNNQQVESSDSINIWDDGYPSGGNYWSDYADIDLFTGPSQDELGGDGIWDHPYVIDFENRDRYPLTEPWAPTIAATVDVDPNALNLMSQGKWITAYIELPEGYDVSEIDSSKIKLYSAIYVDPNAPTELGDYDSDGIPDLMVKFNKAEVVSYIECALNIAGCGFSTVSIRITGKVLDETPFEATDTVKLLFPGDADDDGDVDFDDFIIFAGCYGTSIENQSYHLLADFDEDKYIDFDDFIILAGNYGKTAF